MDNLRHLRAAVYETRRQSGDAILALLELQEELEMGRRLLGKLIAVCPELVEAAVLEIQEEDYA